MGWTQVADTPLMTPALAALLAGGIIQPRRTLGRYEAEPVFRWPPSSPLVMPADKDLPRSWHEAWLDTDHRRGVVDVIVPVIGAWPTMCDDRHPWLLQTVRGTRSKTTTCTRPSGHSGRHVATDWHARHAVDGPVHRVVAVWQNP